MGILIGKALPPSSVFCPLVSASRGPVVLSSVVPLPLLPRSPVVLWSVVPLPLFPRSPVAHFCFLLSALCLPPPPPSHFYFQLSAFQLFPRSPVVLWSVVPLPLFPRKVLHRQNRQPTRCQTQAARRPRAPAPEPNAHREKSRPAAAQRCNPHRRTRLHPQDQFPHQPPATQSQRASIQPRPTPGRGQPPRQPAQTPPACPTSPESLLAPPPLPA